MVGTTSSAGLHVLLNIQTQHIQQLKDVDCWLAFISELIKEQELQCVGSVSHHFGENMGYTAVHCLTESHLSIHTWPERGFCTADIYLSNFSTNNSGKVRAITEKIIGYFNSVSYQIKEIER